MARDLRRHAQKDGPQAAPPVGAFSSSLPPTGHQAAVRLSLVKPIKPPNETIPHAKQLRRIRFCLQTVAILLETIHTYLPIFLRLEEELRAEQ